MFWPKQRTLKKVEKHEDLGKTLVSIHPLPQAPLLFLPWFYTLFYVLLFSVHWMILESCELSLVGKKRSNKAKLCICLIQFMLHSIGFIWSCQFQKGLLMLYWQQQPNVCQQCRTFVKKRLLRSGKHELSCLLLKDISIVFKIEHSYLPEGASACDWKRKCESLGRLFSGMVHTWSS